VELQLQQGYLQMDKELILKKLTKKQVITTKKPLTKKQPDKNEPEQSKKVNELLGVE
jgi:hypothetical protein